MIYCCIMLKNHFVYKITALVIIAATIATVAVRIGFDIRQIITLTVFSVSILGALLFWQFRVSFAFFGSSMLLLTRIITFEEFIKYSSMEIILFLIGMMILVGFLKELGFFTWLLSKAIIMRNLTAKRFMIALVFSSAFMACVLDEVTSIMFMVTFIFEFCDYYEIDPVPFIIASVFATNTGSSGTVIGNPIGLLIAAKAPFTFEDFLSHAFPLMFLSLIILTPILILTFRKKLAELDEKIKEFGPNDFLVKLLNIPAEKNLKIGIAVFAATLMFLVSHHRIELLLGLEANTILLITPLISASCIMIWRREKARDYVEKDVEWWTLLFFLSLFAQSATLTHVGIAQFFAGKLMALAEGSKAVLTTIVLSSSAIISSALDNVVVVASFIPIIKSLVELDVAYKVLWWVLLFGACYGGNLTIIGSTANLIAIGALEKTKKQTIHFMSWLKVAFLVCLVTLVFVWAAFMLMPMYR